MTSPGVARVLLLSLLVLARPGSTPAATLGSGEVYSSIAIQVIAPPDPVLGADGRQHLAYELLIVNPTALLVTLESVAAVAGERTLAELEGAALEKLVRVNGGGQGRAEINNGGGGGGGGGGNR